MPKQPKLTAAADAAAPTPTTNNNIIPYDEAVAEGNFATIGSDPLYIEAVKQAKVIAARMESDWWSLCELADSIVAKYGNEKNKTLIKFAADIGAATVVPCTWERRLSVYRRYKDVLPAPGPVSYAVLRELQDVPNRAVILKDNPGLTKSQARKFAKSAANRESNKTATAPMERNHTRWVREVLDAATAADDCAAQVVRLATTWAGWEPELRDAMRAALQGQDALFQKLDDSAAALIEAGKQQKKFVEFLKRLANEDGDEAGLDEEDDEAGLDDGDAAARYAARDTSEAAEATAQAA
jgi:hypothetical protein